MNAEREEKYKIQLKVEGERYPSGSAVLRGIEHELKKRGHKITSLVDFSFAFL